MTKYALPFCIAVSALALSIGFAGIGAGFAGAAALAGLAWVYFHRRGWDWLPVAGFGIALLGAVAGVMLGAPTGWLLAGVSFALFAWDLAEFQKRLSLVDEAGESAAMQKRHFLHLGGVATVVTVLFLLMVFIRLEMGLWLVIVLAFIFALGLVQLLFRLRAE